MAEQSFFDKVSTHISHVSGVVLRKANMIVIENLSLTLMSSFISRTWRTYSR